MPKEALLVSTVAQVTNEISQMVMEGELKPGEKLNEVVFASRFDVSRNTLREAFRTLIRDGLLVHFINRGVYVKSLDPSEIEKLYDFRRFMQQSCLNYFVSDERCTSLADAMLANATRAAAALEAASWDEVARLNNEFHLLIFEIPDNDQVRAIGRDIVVQFRLVFMGTGQTAEIHGPFVEKNRAIAAALVAGETDRAKQLMEDYLTSSFEVAHGQES